MSIYFAPPPTVHPPLVQQAAETAAEALEAQLRLQNSGTDLKEQNRERVGNIISDAHSAATARGFNLNILTQTATVGVSTAVGDGRIGAQVGAGPNGTETQVGYTNGNFGLTASTGTKDTRIEFGYQSLQPAQSTFNPNSIGQNINHAVEEFKKRQQSAVYDPNIPIIPTGNTR